jgi:hypothetical protein
MKILLLICVTFGLLTQSPQTGIVDRLGVKGPLKFGDNEFSIEWTNKPNDTYYIQEYLPDGQKIESFKEMLTIQLFNTDIKVEDAVKQKVQELNLRKKTDPVCNYLVNENPVTNEYLVDFLLSDIKDDRVQTVEFNVYRYKQITIGDRQAILVYSYSRRSYGNKATSFLKSLKNDRLIYLKQMTSTELPVIILQSDN